MAPCSVTWCTFLAANGSEFCAVHRKHPKLHPELLARDEELVEGAENGGTCPDCDGTGEEECECCHGGGYVDYECSQCSCHTITERCHACEDMDEAPKCETCHGTGSLQVKKKSEAA